MAPKEMTLDNILAIEPLLEDDEKAVRDSIRQWVKNRFLPEITEHHRQGTLQPFCLAESFEGIADTGPEGQKRSADR